jgi:dsRNA-specific ribonuclease
MEDITLKLQELTKSRRIPKLVYKQTNQKRASVFVTDASVK